MRAVIFLLACITVTQQRSIKETEGIPFDLDDFLNGTFLARSWNGSWISDSAFIYRHGQGDILKYDMNARSLDVFLEQPIVDKYPYAEIMVSPDLSYVLFKYNVSAVFRHSQTADFTIYDITKRKFYDIAKKRQLQLVKFAPEGHGLVYVLDNNIYYLDDFSVDIQQPITITTVGKTGVIYCGVSDWVYEEEVLNSETALWFSPRATHLAYAVFHDEQVRNLSFTVYGQSGSLEDQYPHEAVIRYPKAGTPNPVVSVYVYDIAFKTTIEFQFPLTISNKEPNDYIFYGLTWISDSQVAIISSNRVQNETLVIRCLLDGTCEEETSRKETEGWINPILPKYNKDGTKRLEILPQTEGNDRYDHLVLTDLLTNTQTRLTHGKLTVFSVEAWNVDTGIIYYSATANDTPADRNIYVTDEYGNSDCLTCSMIVDGVPCGYGTAYFSKYQSYYTKECLGPNPPLVIIQNAKEINDNIIWEENVELRGALSFKSQPVIKNLLVPINEEFSARVRLYLPPNLDEKADKKYPAIVDTYGGPGNNQIDDAYKIDFKKYLVTNREYVYILIDGRGAGKHGYKNLYQMYRKFATVEIEDQIQITKYLQQNLAYIDAERTGIWGWSYGGFCSSWALAKDKDHVFRAALAVAPVTNFLYYDSIYTERYMGLPTKEDNEVGYNNTDIASAVELFRGRNYFIIHGTADDNVHYQNSMLLVKALEAADIDFRQHSYPDENHSLNHVSRHLYHMMDKYWREQFGVDSSSSNTWRQKENRGLN